MSATEKYNIRPGDDIDLVTTYAMKVNWRPCRGGRWSSAKSRAQADISAIPVYFP